MNRKAQTLLSVVLLISTVVYAQVPEGLNYQAIARSSAGEVLANTALGLKISILVGGVGGTSVYTETHQATTNSYGLFTLTIGDGTSSDAFSAINWASGSYFIKIEMDASGGADYVDFGTSQLLTVPYAMHAKTAEGISGDITETDPVFTAHDASGITSVAIANWDAAFGWGDHALAGYLTSIDSETDPVFIAHDASNITADNITNWNASYDWGDHALAGYILDADDADADPDNEIQNLSLDGQELSISDGNSVTLPAIWEWNESDISFSDGGVVINATVGDYQLDLPDVFSAGGKNLIIGDDAYLTDVDMPNVLGIYGAHDNTQASIKLGSAGPLVSGRDGRIGIGIDNPVQLLHLKESSTDPNIRVDAPDGDGFHIGFNGGGEYMAFSVRNGGVDYWETMNLKSGMVGIGTTNPATALDVNGVVTATGGDSDEWNTAFSWGNHADAGYISVFTELDPVFDASVASGITALDTANWNSKTEFSGNYEDLINMPVTSNIDSTFVVELLKVDEDFINLGPFQNFTNNSSWAIIERVKMPLGTGGEGGWHFFRGKAWEDKEGDIAIQLRTDQIYAWCNKGGWQSVVHDNTFAEDQWYDICFQYNSSNQTLELYVNKVSVGQQGGVAPQDDSGNTNKLFWGGQDVDPGRGQGDLYSEASIVIAHQAWFQRTLSLSEIENYQGYVENDPALYFSSIIRENKVVEAFGASPDGINGNSPEFIAQLHTNGSEFNEPLSVNDNLQVTGDLEVDGNITGNVVIETIHVSKISGLLGQGFTLNFPELLDNLVTLEIEGITTVEKVVMISSLGHEMERIEGFSNGHPAYEPGLSMEYPLIFETTSQSDADNISWWYDNEPSITRSCGVDIKDLSGTETARWTLLNYVITNVDDGIDGRTRFTLVPSSLPDNILESTYDGINGEEWAFNPETDTLVEIEGVSHQYFCPKVELNEIDQTITLTYDANEGGDIYNWAKNFSTGIEVGKRAISVINAVDGDPTQEIGRYNHFECFPIKFEHFYGFGLDTKIKTRVVISYDFREEA